MQTCIYYDMELITEQDVNAVLNQTGTERALHIHKADVEWPATLQVETKVLDSERSPRFRNELMKTMNAVFEEIRSMPAWRRILV